MINTRKLIRHILLLLFATAAFHVSAATQNVAREFNHATTGFALSGGHLVAACETCHIGGVFKGTPRNCDGCHAVGKRVVATPKSSSHIVTDAPCDSCHFNANTWLGARFNHGTAQPGGCQTCHNGRLSENKPASHSTGHKAGNSCDQCHRTYAWLPATWNHTGGGGGCDQAGCHLAGSNTYYRGSGGSHTRTGQLTLACEDCHNYFTWAPARYTHNTGAVCSSCHNSSFAVGKPSGHPATTDECNQCHYSTNAWLPALGAKPANHILYNTGATCSSCHVNGAVLRGATMHAYVSSSCKTCHDSNVTTNVLGVQGRKRLGSHEGSSTSQDCTSCHSRRYDRWDNP